MLWLIFLPGDPLFGGEEDDDDDLFGSGPVKKQNTEIKAKPVQIKSDTKQAQSSDLFGSMSPDEDLFAAGEKSKKSEIPKEPLTQKTEPVKVKQAPAHSKSDNLFGSPSPDKGLFGSPVTSKKTDAKTSEPVHIKQETSKGGSDLLFGSPSPEKDLFAAPVKTKKPEIANTQKPIKDPFLNDKDDNDDDLFGGASTQEQKGPEKTEQKEEKEEEILKEVDRLSILHENLTLLHANTKGADQSVHYHRSAPFLCCFSFESIVN